MRYLYLDIETESDCDLPLQGGMAYAQHPSTQDICMFWKLDEGEYNGWFSEDGPMPSDLFDYLNSSNLDDKLVAHYATFERLFFEYQGHRHGLPEIDLRRWVCSSATCMAVGLPGKLADLARALDLDVKKMTEGRRLIKEYCSPNRLPEF